MPSMFNKNKVKCCAWCIHSKVSEYNSEILCSKHGVTSKHETCRKYKYDPLKRLPEQAVDNREYTVEDFKI